MPATYKEFDNLCDRVRFCTKCPRMDGSVRVLNRSAGPIDAPVMFIGEAPGRLGADSSGIPFHGDKAGHNFEDLLNHSGLTRSSIFVTNSVLCNPKDQKGNNSTPLKDEIRNCSAHLRAQIDLIQPKIVVTLGGTALEATNMLEPHNLNLQSNVRTAKTWYGRILVPLYHPGQRAMLHRSMANQRSDYQFVAEKLQRLQKPKRKISTTPKADVSSLAEVILRSKLRISYFALHKLLFLIEYEAVKQLGRPISSAFFVRQKDGPYCTDLHIQKLKKGLAGLVIFGDREKLILTLKQPELFDKSDRPYTSLSPQQTRVIDNALRRYGHLSDAELKSRVYLTFPMKQMLRQEQAELVNLYNAPIDLAKVAGLDSSSNLAEAH